jgi:hypothetical protein
MEQNRITRVLDHGANVVSGPIFLSFLNRPKTQFRIKPGVIIYSLEYLFSLVP